MKRTLLLLFFISSVTSHAQITDIDGNSYDTVRIGSQTWMSENLNVSRFRNGDVIPEAKTSEEWRKVGEERKPAWCYYDNNGYDKEYGIAPDLKFGKLYNWYAVNDSRGLAPIGWHISSDDEWGILIHHLGGTEVAGVKMKSKDDWYAGDHNEFANQSNESGFSGLPAGLRYTNGMMNFYHTHGLWWSSTGSNTNNAWNFTLGYFNDNASRNNNKKSNGFSVRCLKD